MNRFLSMTLLLVVPVAGAIVGAPGVAASPENDFCRNMAGVGFTADCATLTALAKDVCAQYAQGLDSNTIAQRLDMRTKDENLSNYIVAGASLYFCPNHADRA
jgi:hypothetical protein